MTASAVAASFPVSISRQQDASRVNGAVADMRLSARISISQAVS
jgi:hypothetical protein